jgi:DNA-binding PadR family transcriptional regulator
MIKRIKELSSNALIAEGKFRDFVEKFESELNRGISTLCVLTIIKESGEDGIYAYKILKNLREKTDDMLIIEEATIYPLLRKLEKQSIIESRKLKTGRRKKFYSITKAGKQILNHITGYYSKLTEAISPLFDVKVNLKQNKYYFCPMCANKIDITETNAQYCEICGYNIERDLKKRG